ncbi:DUF6465 family protein [Ruminococcus sp. NK3A76]|uniref:DUF6465 family protein n=1 Tax=Ruminococcus sp. NK3A76 TaxID=877411 RepID=UPI00068B4BFC|nr:DUF6465 family protein [Ruminococcus sp. NK3A76]
MADKNVKEVAAEVKEAAAEKVEKAKTATKKTAAKAKTATKKTAAKAKTAAKTTAAKAKTTAKTTAAKAKTAAKKAVENKQAVFVQYGDKEVAALDVLEAVKADFKANNKGAVKTVKVYIKPEDNAAYYVVNDKVEGKVDL